jgi:hypothetical protein
LVLSQKILDFISLGKLSFTNCYRKCECATT